MAQKTAENTSNLVNLSSIIQKMSKSPVALKREILEDRILSLNRRSSRTTISAMYKLQTILLKSAFQSFPLWCRILVKDMLILIVLCVLVCAESGPIIIRSSINKNQGQNHDANVFDLTQHKGISNFEGEEGFNSGNQQKYVNAEDSGRYGEEIGNKKNHLDESNFADEKFHQEGGGRFSDFGKKVAHKKGHHKSGFHNTYHKDESGSNSSFYDDGGDEGDEYVYDTKKGSYGDLGEQRHKGGNHDSSLYEQDQAKRGKYDHAGKYENDQGNQRNFNRKKYYDDYENEGGRREHKNFGEGGRFNEERYIERPHYHGFIPEHSVDYDDHSYYNEPPRPIIPPIAKRTITVYEDPRYVDRFDDKHQYDPHYDHDYVKIDVKKPFNRYDDYGYDDRRPNYDYY